MPILPSDYRKARQQGRAAPADLSSPASRFSQNIQANGGIRNQLSSFLKLMPGSSWRSNTIPYRDRSAVNAQANRLGVSISPIPKPGVPTPAPIRTPQNSVQGFDRPFVQSQTAQGYPGAQPPPVSSIAQGQAGVNFIYPGMNDVPLVSAQPVPMTQMQDTPTTPTPAISQPDPNIARLESEYQALLKMSPEEQAAQQELNRIQDSYRQGYQNIEDKTIPMEFITGQQRSLEARATNLALPLTERLALEQAKRQAALQATGAALGFIEKRDQSKIEREKLDIERSKLLTPAERKTEITEINGKKVLVDKQTGAIISELGTAQSTQPSEYQVERSNRTLTSVDGLLAKAAQDPGIFGRTAGLPIPDYLRSDAYRNYKAELDTLRSSITFSELTAMREASKTGGALGQISDRENAILSAALGALEMDQSYENVKSQLQKIRDSITRWQQAQQQYAPSAQSGGQPTSWATFIQ